MNYFHRQGVSSHFLRRGIVLFFFLSIGSVLLGCISPHQPITSSQNLKPTQTQAPAISRVNANLNTLITDLEKTMPHAKTEGFIIPGKPDQETFKRIIIAIEDNTPDSLIETASSFNYEILKVSDHGDSDAESYVLREQQPITKAWGLYAFRIHSSQNIIFEAPHPLADKDTPQVALDLYRALQARALLISGAHRNANNDGSADSAHAPESMFQTAHQTLFQLSKKMNDTTIFIQIHGFAADEHPNYPQVVIGHNWNDDAQKDKLLKDIADALQRNNITYGICNGKNYLDLCGTENIQSAATIGGIFIHMELDETIRADDTALVASLKQALLSP